ncbi:MAG: phasin family protein [Xanthomonadales bacterium]|nr:phasin family protein [Xanthomonadales bacterium]MBK7146125.1 phasin family protein [Xanthomonadales bacterium]MCC6560708.1 phasin family protein [Xanthomonadales bacterium]
MRIQSKSKKVSKVVEANEATRKFVLAGLGAVSLVQKQGQKAIDALVAEGEGFQARTKKFVKTANNDARKFTAGVRKQVGGYINPLRAKARKNVTTVENAIGERVGAVLGRFGVPSKGDVQELLARVAELNREIKGGARRAAR